ncbi:uncharacterized protein [Dermacentor albipictus]|uniref:uncharacterized protein n=1 Tax=Dermacentor albipictus TaxID=60249 RepID=UPI0031FDE22A
MGGDDLLNSLISIYRPYLRSKIYYFNVFLPILDLTAVNAWLLYKRNVMKKRGQYSERLLPLAEFKMDLAASLCKAGKTALKKQGRPSNESVEQASDQKKKRGPSAPTPTQDVRLDQVGHWVLWSKKRQGCKLPGCTGICMSYYVKCGVHLCSKNKSNCFFCAVVSLADEDIVAAVGGTQADSSSGNEDRPDEGAATRSYSAAEVVAAFSLIRRCCGDMEGTGLLHLNSLDKIEAVLRKVVSPVHMMLHKGRVTHRLL